MKLEDLKPYNISTLSDLLQRNKISSLVEVLIANFNELLFYDNTIQENELTPSERLILSNGQIPMYWINLKKTNPENYFKKKNRFRQLVNQYGKQNIQETNGNLITQKWNDLLKPDPKTLQKLTGVVKTAITGINRSDKGLYSVNSHIKINEYENRVCLSCGKDISHQRPGTKFCSAKFVGYELAHKCRNFDSNPRNRFKQMIQRDTERGISFLFDITPLLTVRRRFSNG